MRKQFLFFSLFLTAALISFTQAMQSSYRIIHMNGTFHMWEENTKKTLYCHTAGSNFHAESHVCQAPSTSGISRIKIKIYKEKDSATEHLKRKVNSFKNRYQHFIKQNIHVWETKENAACRTEDREVSIDFVKKEISLEKLERHAKAKTFALDQRHELTEIDQKASLLAEELIKSYTSFEADIS